MRMPACGKKIGLRAARSWKGSIMADRVVESAVDQAPELDEVLEAVLMAALNEARRKLTDGEEVVPFTALAVKDNLFIETHPGDEVEECFKAAERTVAHATGAQAYAFCYDGYVETDDGTRDVLIAEGGMPGQPEGYAVGYLYTMPESEDGIIDVDEDPVFIGPAPNFMMFVKPSGDEGENDGEEGSGVQDGVDGD